MALSAIDRRPGTASNPAAARSPADTSGHSSGNVDGWSPPTPVNAAALKAPAAVSAAPVQRIERRFHGCGR